MAEDLKMDADDDVLQKFLQKSKEFGTRNPYPVTSNLTETLISCGQFENDVLVKNITESYPLIHEDVLQLFKNFIQLKSVHGSAIEQEIYKDMDVPKLVDRLLEKRPLLFVGPRDKYKLRDCPERESGRGYGGFELIGTKKEKEPLVMRDYLTYDEMKLSALMATCSPTCTINKGQRRNMARAGVGGEFERHAFIVGLVGTRMVKLNTMECQDIRITPKQNDPKEGYYGKLDERENTSLCKLFADFYKISHFPLFKEVQALMEPSISQQMRKKIRISSPQTLNKDNFIAVEQGKGPKVKEYFNKFVYEARIKVTAETFLAEANFRAGKENKKAYVHVVGLGLGVWKLLNTQHQWYVDAFGDCLKRIEYPHISDIDFSWIPVNQVCGVENEQMFPNTSIKVHISQRNPYDPLEGDDKDTKIIVSSWAYDSNSYPGNEYWVGSLHTSSDPAAACATQVQELHNPLVNDFMSGKYLKIATRDGKITAFEE